MLHVPDGKGILFLAASEGKHGYDYDVYRWTSKGNGYATDLNVFPDAKTAGFLKWRSALARHPQHPAYPRGMRPVSMRCDFAVWCKGLLHRFRFNIGSESHPAGRPAFSWKD